MSSEHGLTPRVWLHMLTEGGRWSLPELCMDLQCERAVMWPTLDSMVTRGSVKRQDPTEPSGKPVYYVTHDCRPPVSITLRQIVEALRKAGETV